MRAFLHVTLFTIIVTASLNASLIQPAGPREKLNFNANWRFAQENPNAAEAVHFDDGTWQTVGVPHTYNETDTFDDWSPLGHRGELNQWGGKTWYRKHFVAPASWSGKRVYIEFEGVRQVAKVYLNGNYLGTSENGFLPFGFDLSEHLLIGETNVLALQCDNSFDTDSTDGIAIEYPNTGDAKFPWNNPHWHPAHGGIYRNVFLHITDPVHVTLPLYSNLQTTGTYITAENITRESADLRFEAQLTNTTAEEQALDVILQIRDAQDQLLLESSQSVVLTAGQTHSVVDTFTLSSPQLWEPVYPYLYTGRVLVKQAGSTLDGCDTPFGIRRVVHNKFTGFFINDRYVKLEGWGQKPTNEWAGLGSALPDWMHELTSQQMVDAGANFLRWGHCAGGPTQIAAGDKLGLITIQPGVDGEQDASGYDWTVRAAAFRDTIIYFRNSPSILIWEGGNQSVSTAHVEELRGYMDTFDPYGGRAYAHRRANSTVEPFLDLSISTEGSGYLETLSTVEGEYNREEAPRRVWDRQTPPYENYQANGSYNLTAEQFAVNQAIQYKKIAPRAHGGGANWIFSDSTSGGRVDTEVTRTSGEVDAVRLPKEAYFATKAIFRDDPQVHIIGHWNYPENTQKTMWVISNQAEVELQINGSSFARRTAETSSPHLFRFEYVPWQSGYIEATAYSNTGVAMAYHRIETTGPAEALRITPITSPLGFQANGSDVALFDIEAIDVAGRRVPTFNEQVNFLLEGPAIWRGGYNSGQQDSTNNLWLDLESGINRVAIRSTLTPGEIRLQADCNTLPSAEILVQAEADPQLDLISGTSITLPPTPPQMELSPPPLPDPQDAEDSFYTENGGPTAGNTRFFDKISYSGPGAMPVVRSLPQVGTLAYSDDANLVIESLPGYLSRGELLAFPNADTAYDAVDLVQLEIVEPTSLYLAHHSGLEEPDWMVTAGFKPTQRELTVGGQLYRLYRAWKEAGSTVLLGGNQGVAAQPDKRMYLLFAAGRPSVAYGVPVSAGTEQSGNQAANAVDGDPDTRWAASSSAFPQQFDLDLGATTAIAALRIHWYNSADRSYKYSLYGSEDGTNYQLIKDAANNTTPGIRNDSVEGQSYRYLRVVVLGASEGWASFNQIEVLLGDHGDPQEAFTSYAFGHSVGGKLTIEPSRTELGQTDIHWMELKNIDAIGYRYTLLNSINLVDWYTSPAIISSDPMDIGIYRMHHATAPLLNRELFFRLGLE